VKESQIGMEAEKKMREVVVVIRHLLLAGKA
jgi:hypothetical protein